VDYDAKIMREMRRWAYRPYTVNGKAVPVCTAATFIYAQPLPAPPAPRTLPPTKTTPPVKLPAKP
jgi:hypothetical protein